MAPFTWSFVALCAWSPAPPRLVLMADKKANIFILLVFQGELRSRWNTCMKVVGILELPSRSMANIQDNSVKRNPLSVRNIHNVDAWEWEECAGKIQVHEPKRMSNIGPFSFTMKLYYQRTTSNSVALFWFMLKFAP